MNLLENIIYKIYVDHEGHVCQDEPYIFNFMDRLNRALNPSVFLTLFPFVVTSVVFLNKCQRTPHRTILYLDQDLDKFIFPFAIIEGTRERVARGLLFGATRELSATGQEHKVHRRPTALEGIVQSLQNTVSRQFCYGNISFIWSRRCV